MKKVIITGATGMVGSLVLDLCLASEQIDQVKVITRRALGKTHSKLKEIILPDFLNYSAIEQELKGVDAALFCIGAYTGQVSNEAFKKISVDIPVTFAQALVKQSPQATFCLLSGSGADRTEKSRIAFAKYKGMAENQLAALGLGNFYTFRPAYIYPVTPRKEPNLMYSLSRRLYPLIKLFGKNASIQSSQLAEAIVKVGLQGADKEELENADILAVLE